MIDCKDFCFLLRKFGFDFSVGVPCSILKGVIGCLQLDPEIQYIPATREEEAIGIATGAHLAGKNPVVLMQNSGLGSSISALATLNLIYKIPILLVISWRGYQGSDAPEHIVLGEVTPKLLEEIGIPVKILSDDNLDEVVSSSMLIIKEQFAPVAILIRRGVIS